MQHLLRPRAVSRSRSLQRVLDNHQENQPLRAPLSSPTKNPLNVTWPESLHFALGHFILLHRVRSWYWYIIKKYCVGSSFKNWICLLSILLILSADSYVNTTCLIYLLVSLQLCVLQQLTCFEFTYSFQHNYYAQYCIWENPSSECFFATSLNRLENV